MTKESYGWKTHPVVKMWKGYETALIDYGRVICQDWISRGYKDTLLPFFKEHYSSNIIYPPWLGDQSFHISHQSNLVRKFPQHYEKFFPNVKPDIDYVWPV